MPERYRSAQDDGKHERSRGGGFHRGRDRGSGERQRGRCRSRIHKRRKHVSASSKSNAAYRSATTSAFRGSQRRGDGGRRGCLCVSGHRDTAHGVEARGEVRHAQGFCSRVGCNDRTGSEAAVIGLVVESCCASPGGGGEVRIKTGSGNSKRSPVANSACFTAHGVEARGEVRHAQGFCSRVGCNDRTGSEAAVIGLVVESCCAWPGEGGEVRIKTGSETSRQARIANATREGGRYFLFIGYGRPLKCRKWPKPACNR